LRLNKLLYYIIRRSASKITLFGRNKGNKSITGYDTGRFTLPNQPFTGYPHRLAAGRLRGISEPYILAG